MRTIRTLEAKDTKPACPECRGKQSHKLDCSVGAMAAGYEPMTLREAMLAQAKPGPVQRCDRCDDRKGLYVFNGYLYCALCWAFQRTRQGSPLPVDLVPKDLDAYHAKLSRGLYGFR